jgi:hypothetical protein
MRDALRPLFEQQIQFRLEDGILVEGNVFIGETEFLPVEILRDDEDAYHAEFNRWLGELWLPEQDETRARILELHGNGKRYADLQAAVRRGQVVPLVGSGMSVPTGLPTWSELLRRLREFTKVDPANLEDVMLAGAFEEAADLLASATNENLLNERIEHDLRVDDPAAIDGSVRILPAVFPDLVITTNLDDVLEQSYSQCGTAFTHVLAGMELARYRQLKTAKERFLLKLHGDCRRGETRVLLKSEYEAAYALGSVTREELVLLYRMNSLLFLGCSLRSDRTVRLVAEVAEADRGMPKHYALQALPESGEARVDRENFLTARGIYPIWYDGEHDEAIEALLAGLLDSDGSR